MVFLNLTMNALKKQLPCLFLNKLLVNVIVFLLVLWLRKTMHSQFTFSCPFTILHWLQNTALQDTVFPRWRFKFFSQCSNLSSSSVTSLKWVARTAFICNCTEAKMFSAWFTISLLIFPLFCWPPPTYIRKIPLTWSSVCMPAKYATSFTLRGAVWGVKERCSIGKGNVKLKGDMSWWITWKTACFLCKLIQDTALGHKICTDNKITLIYKQSKGLLWKATLISVNVFWHILVFNTHNPVCLAAVDEHHCKFNCKHSCITWQVLHVVASPPSVTAVKTAEYLLRHNSANSGISRTGEKISIVFLTRPGKTS